MAKRKKSGRPASPEGRVPLNTTVPPYVHRWLTERGAAETIRRLVDAEIAKNGGKS